MTWLGTAYVVIGMLSLLTAIVHLAQAVVIRSDPTPPAVAVSCLGFCGYALGVATTRYAPELHDPLLGLFAMGLGLVLICAFVPMTGWTLLELPFTRGRLAVVMVLVTLAASRLADVVIHGNMDPQRTLLSVPGALAGIGVALVWTVESVRGVGRGTPFARAMAVFGVLALAATVQGTLVDAGLLPGRELFGLAALPFIAFVTTLSTLRYAHALAHANDPAGDMSRYQVVSQLGSGGMGDVYLARRRGPAGFLRDVVLKTLKESSTDPEAHRRFLAEARLAAQLRHPNIVDVYDLGEQPGGFFIVMEHLSGRTSATCCTRPRRRSGRCPPTSPRSSACSCAARSATRTRPASSTAT